MTLRTRLANTITATQSQTTHWIRSNIDCDYPSAFHYCPGGPDFCVKRGYAVGARTNSELLAAAGHYSSIWQLQVQE